MPPHESQLHPRAQPPPPLQLPLPKPSSRSLDRLPTRGHVSLIVFVSHIRYQANRPFPPASKRRCKQFSPPQRWITSDKNARPEGEHCLLAIRRRFRYDPWSTMSRKNTNPPKNFEEAVAELEQILQHIETGELGLEQTLVEYERGNFLIQHSREVLNSAEKQIELISKGPDGTWTTKPFEPAAEGAE
jgi:exodeoxyribonuclease VII small subunit